MAVTVAKKQSKSVLGGEILTKMLAAEGVEKVFGIIDGTYFGLYSKFEENGISLVTPRHEASAAHMAGAYARLTGGLGVCLASNGPGVANMLAGVAVEQAEGNRVLLITSSRREGIVYPDRGGTYQYFPHVEVIRPMVKWSCAVPSVDRMAELMRKALRVSYQGRPGVVHLDIPENLMNGKFEWNAQWFWEPSQYRVLEPVPPAESQVKKAAQMLIEAKLPVFHVGSGVIHAEAFEEVRKLSELLHAPITTSWAARSAVDERNHLSIPMVYLKAVNQARTQADVLLVLGSRLGESDWWGKAPYWGQPEEQKMIQVDIDTDSLANNRPADLPVQADVKVFLEQVIAEVWRRQTELNLTGRRKAVTALKKLCTKRRKKLSKHLEDKATPMHSSHIATICQDVFDEDAVLVVDGGNTSIWSHFYHEIRTPNSVLTTYKMGMLGAGVSQALGAQVSDPERQVYCIIGDGAMGFHIQEIETAVRNHLPVIYLVVCDKQWGMVKINQLFALKPLKTLVKKTLSPEETINSDLHEIEFDQVARAMGAHGERVSTPEGLRGAIERSVATGRCSVIHIDVDPVKHMWAPELKTFKDMHQEPAG